MNGAHLPPNPRRGGGMQMHAVPENERAIDPKTGQKLPWAYEYADPDRANQRRVPEERGPFGRSLNRRGPSRSKTFTPVGKKEDKDTAENWRAIDDIFTRAKQEGGTARAAEGPGAQSTATQAGVPTEVILYGFPDAYQYSAVEFYERVSGGVIYEDYDRMPPNTRFDLTLSRSTGSRSTKIPPEALGKVNRYHGGDHWIKVTFDSAEAADRACYYSPHTLHGYIVYAERYRGEGPVRDEAIAATKERLASVRSSPSQAPSSSTIQALSSTTVSSATAQDANGDPQTPTAPRSQQSGAITSSFSNAQSQQQLVQRAPKTPLIKGASRAVLLPAENALLPSSSRWQRLFGSWPIVGMFFGGSSQDMIGNEIPRKEDGTFDWDNASLYWWIWAILDYYLFFANFLGLKGDE